MKLLGVEISLPDGFRVEKKVAGAEGVCVDLVGDDVEPLLASIVARAKAAGFVISAEGPGRIELERGELRLLLVFDSSGLTIQAQDPSNLPMARHEGSAVLLADLRVDIDSTSIMPGHERRIGELLRGAWRISGTSASEAVHRVVDAAVNTKALARGPIFAPAKGGREVWTGEAHSPLELVKVQATVEADHVLLEIDIVDKRRESEGA